MTFIHPEFLYYMLPPVLLLFYFLLTQKEQRLSFFSDEVAQKLQVNTTMLTLRARNGLFMLMTVLLITALAQPVIEEGKVKVQAKSADIMVALDISDSMLAEDLYPSRLELAKEKIIALLSLSPQERIGVMAFAKEAYMVSPLSFDHAAVTFLVKQLQTGSITEKGTDFMRLLESASLMLKENEKRYMLLLSDGGDQDSFADEIAYAKNKGIKVFVLGIGTQQGAPIKEKSGGFIKQNGSIVVSRLNEAIVELATQSGGAYIEAVLSDKDIKAMLSEIGSKTTKKSLEEEEITQYIQLFYFPLGLAMLILLIATSSMSRRERVKMPHLFIAFLAVGSALPSHAGLLDFQLLDSAKSAYDSADYNASGELYGEYAARHKSAEAVYNNANALYRSGAFDKAAKAYDGIHTADKELEFNALYNKGNAYVKQQNPELMQQALEAYEKALAIKEDAAARENYEAVKKWLQEQKQQNQDSDQNKNDDNQKKDDQKKDTQQKSDDQKEQNSDKSEDAQPKEDEEQKSQQQSSEGNSDPKEQQKSDKTQQEQQNDSAQSSAAAQPQEAEQQEAERKAAEQKSGLKEEQPKSEEEAAAAAEMQGEQMSDMEAQKWLKALQQNQPGHLYQLQPMDNTKRRSDDEKPW